MDVKKLSLGPLGTNCYIVNKGKDAIIFDPGSESEKIITLLKEYQLNPIAIMLTHAHFDHIGAVDHLRKYFQIDVYAHEEEANWLEDPKLNRSHRFIGEEISTKEPDRILTPGQMNLANFQFEIIHTPGHSPGSVTFIFHQQKFIISGDVLFLQGIGRTDLPGGDAKVLKKSIKNKLYQLDDHFTVLPGHGEQTTIGFEKKNNMFIRAE